MKRRDLVPLSDALGRVASDLGFDASTEQRLQRIWVDVVGVAAAAHAQPGGIREGILRVWVDSGAWATELAYLAPELVERLAERGVQGVDRLVISVRNPNVDRGSSS